MAELFQRDISWERIHSELVRYLRNENRPQFFNSMTIALLPRHGHGFSGEYKATRIYVPMAEPDLDSPTQVGGIQLQSYVGSGGLAGKLRWDKGDIIAVAVDGQHRLAAIKELKKTILPEKLENSSIPVIFLIPDERLGYVEPPQPHDRQSVISSLRRVFIDLNKNAREVSRTRNILLDNQDITSVCTRLLMGDRLTDDPEEGRIPLPLVDWVSEANNKIETGPFMTTVLLLHEIVDSALDTRRVGELEDEEDASVRQWLVRTFGPSEAELEDLMLQVRRSFNQGVPLTFMPAEIAILSERFKKLWQPHLWRIFAELKPYRELWDYGRAGGLHRPEFVNLYVANEILEGDHGRDRARLIENSIRAHDPDWNKERCYTRPLQHIDDSVKKDHWAFKVVFQKGLFYSYLDLLQQADSFLGEEEVE